MGQVALVLLFSRYFYNATPKDWASEALHTQASVAHLMEILGSSWAGLKSQAGNAVEDSWGLTHNVSRTEKKGVTHFWPKDQC